jgi:hypothetical protein
VEIATLEWVDWFNNRRLHSACGNVPPAEYEQQHYRQIAALEPAAPSLRGRSLLRAQPGDRVLTCGDAQFAEFTSPPANLDLTMNAPAGANSPAVRRPPPPPAPPIPLPLPLPNDNAEERGFDGDDPRANYEFTQATPMWVSSPKCQTLRHNSREQRHQHDSSRSSVGYRCDSS